MDFRYIAMIKEVGLLSTGMLYFVDSKLSKKPVYECFTQVYEWFIRQGLNLKALLHLPEPHQPSPYDMLFG